MYFIFRSTVTSNPFNIDESTGVLRISEALDRETKETYNLKVRADDGFQHSDVTLTITVRKFNFLQKNV